MLARIEQIRARAAKKLGAVPAVTSCYEAGYDGFWLHRLLEGAGITNFVFDAASIAVEQRTRRAKTNRIDGELLLRTLMAHLRASRGWSGLSACRAWQKRMPDAPAANATG